MNSNDLIVNVGKNSNDTAALVWSVADDLVGAYKPHEYGLVILPMTDRKSTRLNSSHAT